MRMGALNKTGRESLRGLRTISREGWLFTGLFPRLLRLAYSW